MNQWKYVKVALRCNILCSMKLFFTQELNWTDIYSVWTSLVAQMVKHLPTIQETWVRSLGQEDPLEKEMATLSSTLAWRIPWTEEPCGLQFVGSQRVRHD